jgi:hypothetical protein
MNFKMNTATLQIRNAMIETLGGADKVAAKDAAHGGRVLQAINEMAAIQSGQARDELADAIRARYGFHKPNAAYHCTQNGQQDWPPRPF